MRKIFNRIRHLFGFIFGFHEYSYLFRLSKNCHMLECTICKKKYVMNTSVQVLLEWDQELEDFHREMGHIK